MAKIPQRHPLRSHAFWFVVVALQAPGFVLACDGPKEVLEAMPSAVQQMVRRPGMDVLTFVGYSGAGYESPEVMRRQALQVLAKMDPAKTLINIGATAEGIGAVYDLAKQRGFTTIGIVSSLARDNNLPLSSCVDRVFFVKDSSWGGRMPGTSQLSPTSATIVASTDVVVAIGGGDVARDEALAAQQAGKSVLFIPADMNHRIAQEKAHRAGKPTPTDFRGSLHQAFSSGVR